MEEEHYGNNWDLHAVVRFGCRRALSPPPPRPEPIMPPREKKKAEALPLEKQGPDAGWCFPDLGASGDRAGFGEDANELLKAFFAPPPPPPTLKPLPLPTQQQQKQKQEMLQPLMIPAEAQAPLRSPTAAAPAREKPSGRQASGAVPRSKRRKNQQKKVVRHVAADGVSSDVWAWRKYGQKPIKGSPYPRGYYRCSSSKGCPARKQVERSRADPNTFILTFTGEHNHAAPTHRNSLAGTSRNKFPSPPSSSSVPQPPPPSLLAAAGAHPSPPSTTSTAGLSPTTPLRTTSMEEDDDEEEDELLVEDMEMAGEDDLLFLSGADSKDGATPMSSLFDVDDDPFLGSPWNGNGAAAGAGS